MFDSLRAMIFLREVVVITLFYAGILGLIAIWLAYQAGAMRGKTGISVGDGGNPELLVAMRRHANFVENVPLLLIFFALLEANGAPGWSIHALGGSLVVARIAHAIGLKADTMQTPGRLIGAGGSALITLIVSVWAIVGFFV
jgi:uncharacterized membrane protein YecN with MAPEG domain